MPQGSQRREAVEIMSANAPQIQAGANAALDILRETPDQPIKKRECQKQDSGNSDDDFVDNSAL